MVCKNSDQQHTFCLIKAVVPIYSRSVFGSSLNFEKSVEWGKTQTCWHKQS